MSATPADAGPRAQDARLRHGSYFLACAAVFLVAASARLAGVFNDFWLDEIWSWQIARSAASPWEIVTEFRYDNNHWLNTWFLYWLGDTHWYAYRLLAVATGIASLPLAWLAGRDYGRAEGLLSLLLLGFSYLFIHYSSEARGYAPAVFFALACLCLMQAQMRALTWPRALLFAACASLGFLSHLSFGYAYVGFVLWSVVAFLRRRRGICTVAWNLLAHHGLPMMLLGVLWVVSLRDMEIGGGDSRPLLAVVSETIAWTLGPPDQAAAVVLAAGFAAVAFLREVLWPGERPAEESLFFGTAILLAPALTLWHAPEALYPRYFLLNMLFLLLVLGRFLARCLRRGGLARGLALAALAGFCLGSARYTYAFLRDGRGHYREAIAYLSQRTPGDTVTLGSTNDFRTLMVLDFLTAQEPPPKRIAYLRQEEWLKTSPDWLLADRFEWQGPAPLLYTLPGGKQYVLDKTFPYAGASGWAWSVYRAESRQ